VVLGVNGGPGHTEAQKAFLSGSRLTSPMARRFIHDRKAFPAFLSGGHLS